VQSPAERPAGSLLMQAVEFKSSLGRAGGALSKGHRAITVAQRFVQEHGRS